MKRTSRAEEAKLRGWFDKAIEARRGPVTPVKRAWSITLYTLTPSNNQLLSMHWGARRDLRKRFRGELYYLLHRAGWEQPAKSEDVPKMRLTVQIFRSPRRFDSDNSTGGLKPMIDALRDIRAIRNDSPVWLELVTHAEQLAHDRPRVEITLEEV
ncbi:MAG: hypothetical protein WC455_19195 [Dehalococcoidia bacterium]